MKKICIAFLAAAFLVSCGNKDNKATGDTAASSQDAQRQMRGQPTAAQEAQGAKAKAGNDC